MQYLILIYGAEDGTAAHPQRMPEYIALTQQLAQAGKLVAAEQLVPTTAATSLRTRNGETLITDGPFAEAREALGGFYLVNVANLDEALAIAKSLPAADYGTIEVRPILQRN